MNQQDLCFWMAIVGTVCWVACFLWMSRISKAQNALLNRLQEQTHRIEKLSRVEHDLIKDVHPQVGAINKDIQEMKIAVKQNAANNVQNVAELKKRKAS